MGLAKRTTYMMAVYLLSFFFLFSGLYNIVNRVEASNSLIITFGNMDAWLKNRGYWSPLVPIFTYLPAWLINLVFATMRIVGSIFIVFFEDKRRKDIAIFMLLATTVFSMFLQNPLVVWTNHGFRTTQMRGFLNDLALTGSLFMLAGYDPLL